MSKLFGKISEKYEKFEDKVESKFHAAGDSMDRIQAGVARLGTAAKVGYSSSPM
jgi:hypothetical protein